MTAFIDTGITIAAPRSAVWSVLMDFPRYSDWNPFILTMAGEPVVGHTLTAVIKPPGRSAQTFRPTVTDCQPEVRFQWRGSLPIPGLFIGTHVFELSDATGGTHLAHRESFSGLIVPFLGGVLRATEEGFHDMNRALKTRCER